MKKFNTTLQRFVSPIFCHKKKPLMNRSHETSSMSLLDVREVNHENMKMAHLSIPVDQFDLIQLLVELFRRKIILNLQLSLFL